ncbi:MAG: hypothetical protein BGO67_03010 [Alphaproteobacteria bacterium 41-28]|nr:MAG: hypothetical protein BGO67_03010 [Alphaproteobacteria bacterium 41-28]
MILNSEHSKKPLRGLFSYTVSSISFDKFDIIKNGFFLRFEGDLDIGPKSLARRGEYPGMPT